VRAAIARAHRANSKTNPNPTRVVAIASPSSLYPRELSPLQFQAARHQAVMARVRRSAHAPSGVVVVVSFGAFANAAAFGRELAANRRVVVRRSEVGFDVTVPASCTLRSLLRGAEATTWQAIENF
jgi:hypothetical protein